MLSRAGRAWPVGVYLEENASRSRAAKRLGLHENTISYRVRQAEEALGHPLETHALELRVGLALLPAVRGSADA
jgi:DNA-binding PucR family transcriptional regulator